MLEMSLCASAIYSPHKKREREREINYVQLHRNSDHMDLWVQTRWSVLNLELTLSNAAKSWL
ncbi:MAG: hypothetical protein DSY42_08195 [Aquifex sp.]|nr:MAG: hypothetical protein DSY42_08195 [Aquifex sp.]